ALRSRPSARAGATVPRPPEPAAGEPAFRGRSVRVELGGGPVFEDLSFDVAEGEIVSVLGRSGTGKTTLLRALAGLAPVAAGSTVQFRGHIVSEPPPGVIMFFQDYAASLLPWRTVEANVALGLEGRVAKGERRERVARALASVGLSVRAKDRPWQLSGGMQQRVQLARGLAMDAAALLMDEPFGALDALTKASLQDELLEVHASRRPTILFVTHDIDEAVYLSDRVLVLAGQPARISADIPVDLPRPRHQLATRELPGFLRLRRTVHAAIGASHG
ncbi:MAG: ABC transporter ATP-binding protein, partial [Acidimicrobiales bacterium]